MKNITLAVEDATLEQARQYAAAHKTTVNQMVRDFLKGTTARSSSRSPIEESFRLADKARRARKGWRWNRGAIYDERVPAGK